MSNVVDDDGVLLMTDMEQKAEIDSLDALHAKRRQLLPEYKALRALHGPNGKFDALRKARLEAAKIQARMDMETAGRKVTESAVDTEGHADDGYVTMLSEAVRDHSRYIELDVEMTEIAERVENRIAMLYAWGKEAGMQR